MHGFGIWEVFLVHVSSPLGITSLLRLLVWLWASSADSASSPGCASSTCKARDFLRLHAWHSHCLGSPAPGFSNCSHLCVLLRHVGSPPCPLGAGPGSVGSDCRSTSFSTTSHCPHICCHPFHLHNPPLLVWTSMSSAQAGGMMKAPLVTVWHSQPPTPEFPSQGGVRNTAHTHTEAFCALLPMLSSTPEPHQTQKRPLFLSV